MATKGLTMIDIKFETREISIQLRHEDDFYDDVMWKEMSLGKDNFLKVPPDYSLAFQQMDIDTSKLFAS